MSNNLALTNTDDIFST